MSEQIAETPKEELQCKNKYLYEYAMFWECNDGFKSQILDSDVADLLNEQQSTISQLEEENDNMNLFIKQTIEPLLFNCVFELDTIESMSQVELSRKIEDEIIPFIQDFKYLKYESLEEEKQDKSE